MEVNAGPESQGVQAAGLREGAMGEPQDLPGHPPCSPKPLPCPLRTRNNNNKEMKE